MAEQHLADGVAAELIGFACIRIEQAQAVDHLILEHFQIHPPRFGPGCVLLLSRQRGKQSGRFVIAPLADQTVKMLLPGQIFHIQMKGIGMEIAIPIADHRRIAAHEQAIQRHACLPMGNAQLIQLAMAGADRRPQHNAFFIQRGKERFGQRNGFLRRQHPAFAAQQQRHAIP